MFNDHVSSSETPDPSSNDAIKAAYLDEQKAIIDTIIVRHMSEMDEAFKDNPIHQLIVMLAYRKLTDILTRLPIEYLRKIGGRHAQEICEGLLKSYDACDAFTAAHPDITLP